MMTPEEKLHVEDLKAVIRQLVSDLYGAHSMILEHKGVPAAEHRRHDWAEWSSPAHTLRWAEELLGEKLSNTSRFGEQKDDR